MTPEQKIDKLLAEIQARAEAILEMRIKNTDDRNQIWHLEKQVRVEKLTEGIEG